jgi:hypothetical protein
MNVCTKIVVLRLSADEHQMIQDLAAARGISESDLIRDCLSLLPEVDVRPAARERRLVAVR